MITALKLFAEKGYNATSVEDIIGDVGIARRTFYLHFKGNKEILSLLISKYQKVFTENIDGLGRLVFRKSQEEIKSVLINGIQMLLADQELRWLTKLMLGELIGLQDTFSDIIDSTTEEIVNMTSAAIVRAQEDGTVSGRLNPLAATFCLIGGFKEIMYFDLAESISLAVDLFANGFFE